MKLIGGVSPPIKFNRAFARRPFSTYQPISYIETSAKEAVKVEGAFLEVAKLALINSAQEPADM